MTRAWLALALTVALLIGGGLVLSQREGTHDPLSRTTNTAAPYAVSSQQPSDSKIEADGPSSGAVNRIGQAAERPNTTGERSPGTVESHVGASDRSDGVTLANRSLVTLICAASTFEKGVTVRVHRAGKGNSPCWSSDASPSDSLTVRLEDGAYVVYAIAPDAAVAGPCVPFDVAGHSIDVDVPMPRSFEFVAQAQNSDTGEAIDGAKWTLKRTDLPESVTSGEVTGIADALGRVRFESISAGTWSIEVTADGFETGTFETVLPGDWSAQLERTGRIEFDRFGLVPLLELTFELVGYERSWGDPSAFELAQGHEHDAVAFGSDARATLAVGSFEGALNVKLWFPDGAEGYFPLEAGLPEPGEIVELVVGGAKRLDVEVTLSDAASGALPMDDAWVRCSFRDPSSTHQRFVAQRLTGDGVYSFPQVQSREASYGVVVHREEGQEHWTHRTTELRDEGTTTVSVHVERPPIVLEFVDASGQPVPSVDWTVATRTRDTGWREGGRAGDDGRDTLARVDGDELLLMAWPKLDSAYVVGRPLDVSDSAGSQRVVLDGGQESWVTFRCGDDLIDGPACALASADLPMFIDWLSMDSEGRTAPFRVGAGSSAAAMIFDDVEGYWCRNKRLDVVPGELRFEFVALGTVELASATRVDDLELLDHGQSLGAWLGEYGHSGDVSPGTPRTVPAPVGRIRRGDATALLGQGGVVRF